MKDRKITLRRIEMGLTLSRVSDEELDLLSDLVVAEQITRRIIRK